MMNLKLRNSKRTEGEVIKFVQGCGNSAKRMQVLKLAFGFFLSLLFNDTISIESVLR
jgi:hypothetical protein